MVVKFMKMQRNPMQNRQFFDIFYDEHDKAEKILAFQGIKQKLDAIQSKVDRNASKLTKLKHGSQVNPKRKVIHRESTNLFELMA